VRPRDWITKGAPNSEELHLGTVVFLFTHLTMTHLNAHSQNLILKYVPVHIRF
jgi:hypothetical protein